MLASKIINTTFGCIISIAALAGTNKERPNVILVLTDDQGYGDLGCNGNRSIRTPNIDTFADEAIRMTNFHSGTTSAPTRASLLTGHYNNATGVWHTIMGRSILDSDEYTLANAFSDNGYTTAIFGKWHLGDNYPYRPQDRGFDESLTHGGGGVGQTPDYWGNDYFDDIYYRNGTPEQQQGYCTDIWFREAENFITRHKGGKPFFCYLSLNAPHSPYHIDEEYVSEFRDDTDIVEPRFYGMISNIDKNFGELIELLKNSGIYDNTIIVFMTDNGTSGGCTTDRNGFVTRGYNAGMRGKKGSPYDGGHRVPFFIRVPGFNSFSCNTLTSCIDFMPTITDLCGLDIPEDLVFDGISIKSALYGDCPDENRIICVDTQRGPKLQKYKNCCVMKGMWRLVKSDELYNLDKDPGQTTDIAAEHPELVAELRSAYENWWGKNIKRENDFQYITIQPDKENILTSHDLFCEDSTPAWNQELVRSGARSSGVWAIEIAESGTYEISLFRWPPYLNMPLHTGLASDPAAPNGEALPEGISLDITGARLAIGDFLQESEISNEGTKDCIPFITYLTKGKYFMKAELKCRENDYFSAYYIRIRMATE